MKESKAATFITTGNNQLLKCHIVASKLLLFLAIIVVIVHGHGFVFAATTAAAEDDSNLPSATPPLSIEDDGIELRKEAFLKWFLQNGGIFHPIQVVVNGKSEDGDGDVVSAATVNVTLEQFPSFGGWGLALPLPTPPTASVDVDVGQVECLSDDDDDNTITGQCTYTTTPTTPIIQRLDPLFTVPSSLILSVDSILDIYTIESSPFYLPSFYTNVNAILIRSNPPYSNNPHHGTIGLSRLGGGTMMGLVEQDVVIAMHLMVEECHHQLYSNTHHQNPYNVTEDSYWGEYLDVLPQYTIPRLDTFGNEEYAALQDDNLEFVGRNSKRLLERMFLMNQYENDDSDINADAAMKQKKRNGISLQGVVREMIHRKLDIPTMTASLPESSATALLDSCTSFEAFHRFVGVVASRAMVLNGRK